MLPVGAGQIAIPREQIENQITLLRAKATMQKAALDAHIQQAVSFRALVTAFLTQQGFSGGLGSPGSGVLRAWTKAHEQSSKCQEDLFRTVLGELNSQLAIHESALANADKKVKIAGRM